MKDGRANNFDFLRVFAASLVILSHSFPLTGSSFEPYAWLTGYDTFGTLAVEIFFVMSGFLVTRSWLDDARVVAFFRKRVLRIFPALAAAVALAVVFVGPLVTALPLADYFQNPETRAYLKNIFLFPIRYRLPGCFPRETNPYWLVSPTGGDAVNGSLWTLPIEVSMYLVLPVLGKLRVLSSPLALLAVVLGLVSLEAFYATHGEHARDIVLTMEARYVARLGVFFFTGALMQAWRPALTWSTPVAAGLLVLLVASFRTELEPFASHVAVPYFTLQAAFADAGPLRNAGKHGDFSYGMYVYAFPIQQTLVCFFPHLSPLRLFPAAFLATLAVSVVSWHALEKPALGLKGRKPPAPEPAPAPSVAEAEPR
ncbi:acyltransferase [bacterium]|nr:acyltransferase [bacterium]